MRKFFLLLLCAIALGANTVVQMTVVNPDGSPAAGIAYIRATASCTSGAQYLGNGVITVRFTGGVFSVSLIPNDTCTPLGSAYSVAYQISGGQAKTEYWVVPTSVTPVNVSAVRVAAPPSPNFAFNPRQLDQSGATLGQCLVWAGTTWAPQTCGAAAAVLSIFGRTGAVTAQTGDYTTSQVSESGNLYFTATRARSVISATSPLGYDQTTGVLSCPTCGTGSVSSVFARTGAITAQSGDYTTTQVTEGTNLYFTNARSRTALSGTSPISYDSSTGAISCPTCGTGTGNMSSSVYDLANYASQVEVTARRNAASGYAGLDGSSKLAFSQLPTGTSSSTVAVGNDSRFTDSRTPTAHATSHKNGGSDEIATATPTANAIPKAGSSGKLGPGWMTVIASSPLSYDSSTGTFSCPTCGTGSVSTVFGRSGTVIAQAGDYTSAQVTEGGANLYYTDTRARAALSASSPLSYNSTTGAFTCPSCAPSAVTSIFGRTGAVTATSGDYTTPQVTEAGASLYFTNARARSALSATSPITFNSTTGVIDCPTCATGAVTSIFTRTGAVTAQSGDYDTLLVTENTNLYFTPARARAALSGTAPIDFNSTTGAISCPTCGTGTGNMSVSDYDLAGYASQVEVIAHKGAASGYASLDGSTKVPIAQLPTGTSSSTVAIGNDSRLSDARTPTAHATSHKNGGSDEVATATPAANAIPKAGATGKLAPGWSTFSATAPLSYDGTTGGISCPTCGTVTSVFGRSGAVTATSGDYTTTQVTEGTNLYFTNARSRAALSALSPLSYNSSTGAFSCPTCATSSGNMSSSVYDPANFASQVEVTARRNAASGYAGLDGSSKLAFSQLPTGTSSSTVAVGNDGRFTDARTPTSHAATHQNGGSDEVATVTPTANAIPKAAATGKLAVAWIPVSGSTPLSYNSSTGAFSCPTCTVTIASGSVSLGTAAVGPGSCTTITASASGLASTDVITYTPNGDITSVTGYAPNSNGGLQIYPWPSANQVNFKVCNPTIATITPGSAVTLNWRITR